MWGLRGRYFLTPPSPCPRMYKSAQPFLAGKTTSYFLEDASAERSSGNSVRIPKRFRAAPHFCGGRAFVKISAAWSLVSTYSMVTSPSANTSDKHDKFTLCVLVICLSLGLYPFLTTRIVAWLSSITRSFTERWRSSSHNCKDGIPSWYKEYARDMTSLSVVDLEVEVCRLDTQAKGKNDVGPRSTRNPPEVDLAFSLSPAKSASTYSWSSRSSSLSLIEPANL